MIRMFDGFHWDDGNWPKCGKHGLSRRQIEQVFQVVIHLFPDPQHSDQETRFLAFARIGPRGVLVAFTVRSIDRRTLIRPISARYMHAKEVEHYERQTRPDAASRSED